MTRAAYLARLAAQNPEALRVSAELAVTLEEETMSDRVQSLIESMQQDMAQLAAMASKPSVDILGMLTDLAEAKRAVDVVAKRYHGQKRIGGGYVSAVHEEEWTAAWNAHDAAVAALTKYALAMTEPVQAANEQSGWHVGRSGER